jgi:hypothetical protein
MSGRMMTRGCHRFAFFLAFFLWFWGNIFADCIDRMRLEASWAAGCRWLGFFAPLVLSWGRLRDQQELSTHALAETGRSSSGGSSGR